MNQTEQINEQIKRIADLDLEPIKFKLMHIDEGLGWPLEKVDLVENDYKRFLTLILKHPDRTLMPSHDIDHFWHTHILDTIKYSHDCESIFGYFLHHFPYTGLRGPEDKLKAECYWADTKALFEREFGVPMYGQSADCDPTPSCSDPIPPGSSCDNKSHDYSIRPRPNREYSTATM